MYKSLIKLYFVASIGLIVLVTMALAIVLFGESWTFYQAVGLDYVAIEENLLLLIRFWIANVGVSSFIAVASYAKQQSLDYTAKTALYAFVVNVIYGFVLIVVLRRLLKKQPFSLGSLL
jgi:sensor domain CHASE-containing protein